MWTVASSMVARRNNIIASEQRDGFEPILKRRHDFILASRPTKLLRARRKPSMPSTRARAEGERKLFFISPNLAKSLQTSSNLLQTSSNLLQTSSTLQTSSKSEHHVSYSSNLFNPPPKLLQTSSNFIQTSVSLLRC